MSFTFLDKILSQIGQPDLVRLLSEDLTGTHFNSVLLSAFKGRVSGYKPPTILRQYQHNRYVKPSDLPVLALRQTELDLLRIFAEHGFTPIELSPVTVLGACSVVAPADQNKVLSALRGTEVLADATNAMALHIGDLKKRRAWVPKAPGERLRLSTIQRHVRTQPISGKGFTPHFKIGCFVSSGTDTGSFTFEKEALSEQIHLFEEIFLTYYQASEISFRLLCRNGYPDALQLATELKRFLEDRHPQTTIYIVEKPERETGYYNGIQYKVEIKLEDTVYEIGDGGFVDWTQQLLQNKKERFLIAGFGFEFMYRILQKIV